MSCCITRHVDGADQAWDSETGGSQRGICIMMIKISYSVYLTHHYQSSSRIKSYSASLLESSSPSSSPHYTYNYHQCQNHGCPLAIITTVIMIYTLLLNINHPLPSFIISPGSLPVINRFMNMWSTHLHHHHNCHYHHHLPPPFSHLGHHQLSVKKCVASSTTASSSSSPVSPPAWPCP